MSIILIRVNDQDRIEACLFSLNMSCQQIFVFLKDFARRAVEDASREWSCYALTLLCLKILDYTKLMREHGKQSENAEHRVKILLREALESAVIVLPLVLRLKCKDLQHQESLQQKIVRNIIIFWHDIQRAVPELDRSGLDFAKALDREASEQSRIPDLCRLIIQNADVLSPFADSLQRCLYQHIRTSINRHSLTSCDLIIRAAATIVKWSAGRP